MEPHSEEYLRENGLIREMMKQGEFSCLVDLSDGEVFRKDRQFIIQWWCRKTDQMYESAAPTLMEALCSVLGQAHADPDPWVTEEQLKESAEHYKIQIFIPCVPEQKWKPVCKDADYADADFISKCLSAEPNVSPVLMELAKRAYEAHKRLNEIEDVREHDTYTILADKLRCRGWFEITTKENYESHKTVWVKPNRNPIVVTLDYESKLVHVERVTIVATNFNYYG
jgi:hypothetical protein